MVDSVIDNIGIVSDTSLKNTFCGNFFEKEILFRQANMTWLQEPIYRIYASRDVMT